MKLQKLLTVNNSPVKLVQEDVRLDLRTAGRAMFRVLSPVPLAGIVRFSVGYSSQSALQMYFTGFVERSYTVDSGTQRLMCRELTAVLEKQIPLSLRHPTLEAVLAAYTGKTGLRFIVPERAYSETPVPCFQTLGNGFHGLDSLGAVFGIDAYIWQQQANGSVFVGSWQDCRWASRPVTLPEKQVTAVGNNGCRTVAAIPALRTGVKLNGEYVTGLQLAGHEMVMITEKKLI